MPLINCDDPEYDFTSIDLAEDGCACNVQFTRIAFARRTSLDLDNITLDADGCATDIIMKSGGFFEISGIDSDLITYTASLDSATCKYNNTLSMDVKNCSKQLRNINCNMQNFCDWTIWASTNTCKYFLLGVESLNGVLGSAFPSKLSGHELTIGGTAQLANVWTFTWPSYCEGAQTFVDYENLPLI